MINPHPGLPEFDYIRPGSLLEASQFLAAHAGEARPLMGGTDIFVRMRDGDWEDKYLVDIKGLDGMNDISFNPSSVCLNGLWPTRYIINSLYSAGYSMAFSVSSWWLTFLATPEWHITLA